MQTPDMTEAELGSIPIYPPELGTPVRNYRQGPRAVGLIALRVLVLLAAVGITYLCGLTSFEGSLSTWSQSPILFCIIVPAALIIAGAGLPKMRRFLAQWNDLAVVQTDGLAYRHRGVWRRWPWPEIAEVTFVKQPPSWGNMPFELLFLGFLIGNSYTYRIAHESGEQLTIGETLDDVDELVAKIQEQTAATRLAAAEQAFGAGEMVCFGAICLDPQDGILSSGNRCPWEQVASIWIPKTDSYASVYLKQGADFARITVPVRDISNADVLLALAARRLGMTFQPGDRFISIDSNS